MSWKEIVRINFYHNDHSICEVLRRCIIFFFWDYVCISFRLSMLACFSGSGNATIYVSRQPHPIQESIQLNFIVGITFDEIEVRFRFDQRLLLSLWCDYRHRRTYTVNNTVRMFHKNGKVSPRAVLRFFISIFVRGICTKFSTNAEGWSRPGDNVREVSLTREWMSKLVHSKFSNSSNWLKKGTWGALKFRILQRGATKLRFQSNFFLSSSYFKWKHYKHGFWSAWKIGEEWTEKTYIPRINK